MSTYTVIDPENWVRKAQFDFFRDFDQPFSGLVAEVDVTEAHQYCKDREISFFLYYLHLSAKAVNSVQAMRLRWVEDEIRLYQTIHASATIMRPDKTFGFSWILYDDDFEIFCANAESEIARIHRGRDLLPAQEGPDAIHYSIVPWISFTAMDHARNQPKKDSVPKISFGKFKKNWEEKLMMPVSVHVHHALADGIDISLYLDKFQNLLNRQ